VTTDIINGKKAKYERRCKRAEDRRNATVTLTPEQRLQRLDEKLGAGVGARKERAKLQAQIEARKSEKKGKEKKQ
jgi:hypothetical protein